MHSSLPLVGIRRQRVGWAVKVGKRGNGCVLLTSRYLQARGTGACPRLARACLLGNVAAFSRPAAVHGPQFSTAIACRMVHKRPGCEAGLGLCPCLKAQKCC